MAGRPALQITPHTAADNFYSIAGGTPSTMRSLQNLVPTIDALDEWVPRPAATLFANSNTFSPGFVSCQIVVGTKLYGMVSSAANAGKDQPFCYDLIGGAFITVTGFTSANVPTSPPTTGAWTPPHCELIGAKVVITHTGYSGTGTNYFGLIDISNPATPVYSTSALSVGTGGVALPSVPIWCTQFNNRAYFLCNPTSAPPAAIFSDVLNPATFYNGSVAPYTNTLTFGGNLQLTCGGTVSFDNQLGGQTQALIVFQGASNMWQVTGDPSFSISIATTSTTTTTTVNPAAQGALAINSLNVATGTLAPNTICQSPRGLLFVAPDGLRLIDFNAHVSDPIGFAGKGIALPFIASTTPSRMAAACNATTVRISTINGSLVNTPQQEWCFDLVRQIWYGPHTFPVSLITFYGASYIISPIGIGGFWSSDIIPNSASTYVENGSSYQCVWQSAYLPDRPNIEELSVVRAVFYQAYGSGTTTYTVSALDSNGNVLAGSPVSLVFTGSSTTWGAFAWGYSLWLGTTAALAAAQVPWTQPLVFDRVSVQISVQAAAGVRLGNFMLEMSEEDYTVLAS